ncbi:MAG: tRNA (guanine-N7-)-methyltransferase [Saprospiraceae bacterium]|jgi:tRNA (guanine-N7-)-methyltransferase
MPRRNKLEKFAEILSFPNVYENYDPQAPQIVGKDGIPVEMKGNWTKNHFNNDNPLVLELACGKGDYTLGLAERFPDKNFIGIDVKGNRIWKGASTALENKLDNAAFFRSRIEQIALFFEKEEVSEIWITFPDPFLREGKSNRRLTSPFFINHYRKILKPGGIINLKTDSPVLYEFTLETISADPKCGLLYHENDIYSKPLFCPELEIKTFYEKMHLEDGRLIKYVKFTI